MPIVGRESSLHILGNENINAIPSSHGYTFRKEGYTKIIEYDLSRKQKDQHHLLQIKRPNILLDSRHKDHSQTRDSAIPNGRDDDSDDDMDVDEPPGEDVMSDAEAPHEGQLPKSASGKTKTLRGRNERVMMPEECRAHLRRLFHNESVMCGLLFGRHGPFASVTTQNISLASADMFFLSVLPVPPTRFRPPARMGEMLFEHPQNELLTKVLQTSYRLREIQSNLAPPADKSVLDEGMRRRNLQQLLDSLIQLQHDVNSFIDSSKNPAPVRQGKLPPAGVKQLLEKKEGLFRKHMMVSPQSIFFNRLGRGSQESHETTSWIGFQGKRVNYAARSVISPDVNIEPNEIGIPPVFARKLTYPEPVTPANVHELRALVIAGPRNYPGATMVEYEDGHHQLLVSILFDQFPFFGRRSKLSVTL